MKASIIFIGTGKYLNFLPNYYQNIHKHFLPNTEKKFLVFTDGQGDYPDDIISFHQEHLNWPFITLKRFEIISKAVEEISKTDWLIFMDADTLVVDDIHENDFFTDKKYFGVHHPCHYLNMSPHNTLWGAFEKNEKSKAYFDVEKNKPKVYFQGCLWGGKVPDILDAINLMSNRVNEDLQEDIVALWHDETHLNKFFNEEIDNVNILSPSFAYPEVFSSYCNFPAKIIHLAKDNSKYQI